MSTPFGPLPTKCPACHPYWDGDYFFYDFSDTPRGLGLAPVGWIPSPSSGTYWQVDVNGHLISAQGTLDIELFSPFRVADGWIEALVTKTVNNNTSFQVGLRGQDVYGHFALDDNGFNILGFSTSGGVQDIAIGLHPPFIGTYRIGLMIKDDFISAYLNGRLIGSASDNEYMGLGSFVLHTYNVDNGGHYNWVRGGKL